MQTDQDLVWGVGIAPMQTMGGMAGKVVDLSDPAIIAEHKRYGFEVVAKFATKREAYDNVEAVMDEYARLKEAA